MQSHDDRCLRKTEQEIDINYIFLKIIASTVDIEAVMATDLQQAFFNFVGFMSYNNLTCNFPR